MKDFYQLAEAFSIPPFLGVKQISSAFRSHQFASVGFCYLFSAEKPESLASLLGDGTRVPYRWRRFRVI
ncbi:MAG: hypothetical protein KIH09_01225 [Candidatus Freyarchaeota archaeon]|nr:hypothetical protein [Candidatus Jordarchaeia archaeon]